MRSHHRISSLIRFALTLAAGLVSADFVAAAPSPLHVRGTRLVDGDGTPVRLRGVNCASMEWTSNGEGRIAKSVEVAVQEWHANLIRLPLSQDRWFGKAPEQTDGGAAYRALVKQLVEFCAANDAYILLDLHWSDAGEWGRHIGQHNLPDKNSVVFWKDLAAAYANHPAVLFDLYNEPCRTNWDEWFKGGPVTEKEEKTKVVLHYDAVGMQQLVDTVRAAGAKNVIVAGGINWAYELEGIYPDRQLVEQSGDGIVYACHPYPHAFPGLGRETIAQWAKRMETFSDKLPLIVTEFGSDEATWPFPKDWHYDDERWNRGMLHALEEHQWNWTAWDFHVSASPCLIADWDYTPTPHFGVWVKGALGRNHAPRR